MSIFKKRLTFYIYNYIIICARKTQYRDVGQFGSFEFDRVRGDETGKTKRRRGRNL